MPPQLPLQEQHDGPTPADMLVAAFVPSELQLQLPAPVQVQPAAPCHSVIALQPVVSYAYVPVPITVSVASELPPPPVHSQLAPDTNAAKSDTLMGVGGAGLGGGGGIGLGGGTGLGGGGIGLGSGDERLLKVTLRMQ